MQEIKTSIQCQIRGILNPHMGLKISWLILYVVFLQRDLGAQPEMFLLLLQEDCMLEILWFSGPVEVRSRENCTSASKNGVTAKIAVPPIFEAVLQFFVFTPYFLPPLPPLPPSAPLPPLPLLPPLESLGECLAPGISLGGADFEGASAADFFCLAAFFAKAFCWILNICTWRFLSQIWRALLWAVDLCAKAGGWCEHLDCSKLWHKFHKSRSLLLPDCGMSGCGCLSLRSPWTILGTVGTEISSAAYICPSGYASEGRLGHCRFSCIFRKSNPEAPWSYCSPSGHHVWKYGVQHSRP